MNIEEFLHQHFLFEHEVQAHLSPILNESMKYSLNSGGKRFRPHLISLLCSALNIETQKFMPFAAAMECIHTYSLIHDDLPCMDNDSIRRGKPTNHIVYGETTALLAGDGLLTEAFHILGKYYSNHAEIGIKLVQVLAQAAGPAGMIAGQQLDLQVLKLENLDFEQMLIIHRLKTAALLRACAKGSAIIAHCDLEKQEQLALFGETLGLAFQLKDDILDFIPDKPEKSNLVTILSLSKAEQMLENLSTKAMQLLSDLQLLTPELKKLVNYNKERNT